VILSFDRVESEANR